MILKEQFCETMNNIKQLLDRDDQIVNAAETIFGGFPESVLGDSIDLCLDILAMTFNKARLKEAILDDLTYFVFELEWGKNWTKDSVTDITGKSYDLSSVEKLYDYIVEMIEENER